MERERVGSSYQKEAASYPKDDGNPLGDAVTRACPQVLVREQHTNTHTHTHTAGNGTETEYGQESNRDAEMKPFDFVFASRFGLLNDPMLLHPP